MTPNAYSGATSTVNTNQEDPAVNNQMFAVPEVHFMQCFSRHVAGRAQPVVENTAVTTTIVMLVLGIVVYDKGLAGVAGSLAVIAQPVFFAVMTSITYWFGFGLRHERKIVPSAGMATRNRGAAPAPLVSIADMDRRAIVMVVLGLPIMVAFAFHVTRWLVPFADLA
jgi:BASS family bile acid:Na+ symporter